MKPERSLALTESVLTIDSDDFSDLMKGLWQAQVQAVTSVGEVIAILSEAASAAAARLQGGGDVPEQASEGTPKESLGRLIFVGAGTSGRLCQLDASELSPTFGWLPERSVVLLAGGLDALIGSVEGAEDDRSAGRVAMEALSPTSRDVVVAVSASGQTPYALGAVCEARAAGTLVIGIANNSGRELLEESDFPVFLATGAEFPGGSTRMKAGTAQKAALSLLSTGIMMGLGRVYRGRMVAMRLSNRKLRERAVHMVRDLAGVDEGSANAALQTAQDDIRVAILIGRGYGVDKARKALDAAHGDLARILGP